MGSGLFVNIQCLCTHLIVLLYCMFVHSCMSLSYAFLSSIVVPVKQAVSVSAPCWTVKHIEQLHWFVCIYSKTLLNMHSINRLSIQGQRSVGYCMGEYRSSQQCNRLPLCKYWRSTVCTRFHGLSLCAPFFFFFSPLVPMQETVWVPHMVIWINSVSQCFKVSYEVPSLQWVAHSFLWTTPDFWVWNWGRSSRGIFTAWYWGSLSL